MATVTELGQTALQGWRVLAPYQQQVARSSRAPPISGFSRGAS
jgi:hypothetical protein